VLLVQQRVLLLLFFEFAAQQTTGVVWYPAEPGFFLRVG